MGKAEITIILNIVLSLTEMLARHQATVNDKDVQDKIKELKSKIKDLEQRPTDYLTSWRL